MKHQFTETQIETKHGTFIFRVYADSFGKETVVLRTPEFDPTKPVMVRVHSECMTGDTFGSLQCDCADQLHKSLELINASSNGALVYLRQEGRGIGLFEKIRSYELQRKGYDTFEANVILGHRPDERTYEWAKTALNDLGVERIRLLTNNPSKVSEIAKLGITVVERVPLIAETNQFNKKYFDAKRDKFKHFFNEEVSYYFYQFHAETADDVHQIGVYLRDKKRDPLLKICVGVGATHETFSDSIALDRIAAVFKACELYEGFVPILHFSFLNSPDRHADLQSMKQHMPYVGYIQTNDVTKDDMPLIQAVCEAYLADIPLDNDSFSLVHDVRFREVVQKNKAFVLLDNSKGAGVRESKESLMKKIDTLLSYGLNDIAIYGGFGPDELDTYFELRRHYRINFSIDAETKLKTDGHIDIEKTKLYLSQLLRFDDPKQAGVEQSRAFLQQKQLHDWTTIRVADIEFVVHPAVFNPSHFPSTAWYIDSVSEYLRGQKDFCEVGCGAGAVSAIAALRNPNLTIVATDINPFAAETAKLNAERLGISGRLSVYQGDVLDGIPQDARFDTIFWSLPFGFLDPGATVSYQDMQLFDPGYRATRKFFQTARKHLKPAGVILLGFSDDLGHPDLLADIARDSGVVLERVAEKEMVEKDTITFLILRGTYSDLGK